MRSWIPLMMDRFFAVIGALIFLQFPLYMQQYDQRLSGHIEELRYQVGLVNEVAVQSGKTMHEYVGKFLHSTDNDYVRQGELLEAMSNRLEKLTNGYASLRRANFFTKPFVFLYFSDWEIVKSTGRTFTPGVPLSFEGIMYGIVGIFAGYFLFRGLSRLFMAVRDFVRSVKTA